MSEHDGSTDPYRTPDAHPWSPPDPSGRHPSQPYPAQPYPARPGADGVAGPAARPAAVGRLRQVMLAGAVAAALQGAYGVVVVDDLVAASAADLEQVAAEAGLDPERLAEVTGSVTVGVVVVVTVVTVGLWLLFARLFDRGTARVAGTVLGGLNGLGLLVAVLFPTDVLEWVFSALSAALVVAGLVLLWLPVSSAWFRAAAAARAQQYPT